MGPPSTELSPQKNFGSFWGSFLLDSNFELGDVGRFSLLLYIVKTMCRCSQLCLESSLETLRPR
eukprot:3801694-Pyramimonas_sp.AAC.1